MICAKRLLLVYVVRMNTSYGSLFVKPKNGFMMVAFLGLNHIS